MSKTKTAFFCKNCGYESPKWLGKCTSCGAWNSFTEEVIERSEDKCKTILSEPKKSALVSVHEIEIQEEQRLDTRIEELNRVLGGGLVSGSLILLGGEPGIGKSTLLLQMALKLPHRKILYISGEESETQLKMRADRIGIQNPEVYILAETDTKIIFSQAEKLQPDLLIVDSIQTMKSSNLDSVAGSISQLKETAAEFQYFSKKKNIPVFLIGHITKDGSLAGPKLLEHIVDAVLQFEGDRHYGYRMVRALKNRFGSTNELAIFEMVQSGLREVSNPSELLISQREEEISGVTVAVTVEGVRPILTEVQALVSTAVYGTPQRSATGYDLRRLNMLLAVLEKRANFKIGAKDVFINMAGGIRVEDPAISLSVTAAILSSAVDISVSSKDCFAGEVGLSGEIRAVSRIEQRLREAEKLGYERIFISKYNLKGLDVKTFKIKIIPLAKVEELVKVLFN